jgi:hypothetical protein
MGNPSCLCLWKMSTPTSPHRRVDHVENVDWGNIFPLSMAEKMWACQYRSFRSGRCTYGIQEERSKTMPRILMSQADGEMMASRVADASVEDDDFDQMVGSKDHHQLAEFLLTCYIRLHPFRKDVDSYACLFVYENAATLDTQLLHSCCVYICPHH